MEDLFNTDITVVNKYFDRTSKSNKYKLSYIKGFWNAGKGINIDGVHLVKQDTTTAIILINDTRNEVYQKPKEFISEPKTWTLQEDDYLVKGKVENFSSITALLEEVDEIIKISKIIINDNGSEDMWNFEVEGK